MVAALAGSEHPVDLRRATVYVGNQLKTWVLAPSAVPAGGYGDLVPARIATDDQPVWTPARPAREGGICTREPL